MPEKKVGVKVNKLNINDLGMSADISADIPRFDLCIAYYNSIRWRGFAIWLRLSSERFIPVRFSARLGA
jgi:hypothetical protein